MTRRIHVLFFAAILLALAGVANDASQSVATESPVTASRFGISIDGVQIASFSELVALTVGFERQALELTSDGRVLLPGRQHPPTVTLKRGKNDHTMQDWLELALLDNAAARRTCTFTMFKPDGTPLRVYHLEAAWPMKIELGSLKAGQRDVLMETVTLVADAIREEPGR